MTIELFLIMAVMERMGSGKVELQWGELDIQGQCLRAGQALRNAISEILECSGVEEAGGENSLASTRDCQITIKAVTQ